jgi:hypothetical protein
MKFVMYWEYMLPVFLTIFSLMLFFKMKSITLISSLVPSKIKSRENFMPI